ncbi:DDE-type integrase/transposase/recombinase [Weizmannia coagulans]|jgi:transposase InsO family protein|uniref:Integrase catalytic region n=8 Tax=Heyndrickxia TaxID=2837504 RepID=G2TQX2_HEYCO|nr:MULTISPECIES: DDE-type integrase/transposase/recombinase [Heyndrickxia]NWN95109.1 DDE-type integrase/transposase/recombinase [Bacillus sp. (in: firmicutes)]AEP00048.1 Integrase catalytic region [Heyndrickxia coagulans 36D1]AKN53493.1 Mobile element protein [Heyndrickxia coagulans]APB37027.1 transposase [Heyndrickxia coagulans]APB37464.1 transposase [Heyndrickxia coagulans]
MDHKKADEMAAQRFQLISPLLADGLDAGKAKELKEQICKASGLSERTIRRYLTQFRKEGFSGLKPKGKQSQTKPEAVPPHIIEQAILLRREAPSRSVSQIIQILEWEGLAEPGQIKRSTLQEKLSERGYSSRQMRLYSQSGVAARRFQKRHRNQLWQSDIKYGPYLPIGPNGAKKQVYLVAIIDDATRYVLHGEFYPTLDSRIVEDAFRQAVQKYGAPEAVYFDNGKQYRTKWMGRTCSKLGTRLVYAKPFSPESKGKVEKFNRLIDSFLGEVSLEKPKTLERLNELFQVWLTECYQEKPHSALGEKISPRSAFRSDRKALRFIEPDTLADAFLHCETRKVDKSGCISFMDQKYEVGLAFIGQKVEVIYDPADLEELTIEFEGYSPWKAHKLEIGERSGKRPPLPDHLQPQEADSSRLLKAAEQKYQERQMEQTPAVSFRAVWKEDGENV